MKNLELSEVRTYNKGQPTQVVSEILGSISSKQGARSARFGRARDSQVYARLAEKVLDGINSDPLSSPDNSSSGAYFANENVIGGSATETATLCMLGNVFENRTDLAFRGRLNGKLKLGPGIGFVRPPDCYLGLASEGLKNPNLILNYNAPGGTAKTRVGIKRIIDASIEAGADIIPVDGCFVAEGATEALQLGIQAYKELQGGSGEVIFLGTGYYAGPFAAQRLKLPFQRKVNEQPDYAYGFLPKPDQLRKLSQGKKLIVATTPNNPDGSDYSERDWQEIITILKQNPDTLILLDNIFGGLRFDGNTTDPCLKTAKEMNFLDRVCTVSSLSKTVNFAGDRVGWIATANPSLAQKLSEIIVDRRCNPRLTVEPILDFEGKARQVQTLMREDTGIKKPVDALVKLGLATDRSQTERFGRMYAGWAEWQRETKQYYRDNLGIVEDVLGKSGALLASSPNKAGFNTFVRLNVPAGTNSMDFLTQLMLTTGVYTQLGPCFGISQNKWDNQRGLWVRISYACDRQDLVAGLERVAAFTKYYAEQQPRPALSISYDKQI